MLLTCAFKTQSGSAQDASPLYDAPPLSHPVEQLREWAEEKAQQHPKPLPGSPLASLDQDEVSLVRLFHQQRFHFTADGKVHVTAWEITKVKDKVGAAEASSVTALWEPWNKERPTIKARVINRDGKVITNDGKEAAEQAAGDADAATESRQLTLVLQGVEEDSIVETLISNVEHIEGGAWYARASLSDFLPAKVHQLVISYDKDCNVVHRNVGPDVQPRIMEAPDTPAATNGAKPYKTIIYHADLPQPIMAQMQSGCGPDRSSVPMIEFGIPRNWSELGKLYAQSVEKAIADGNKTGTELVKSVSQESQAWSTEQKIAWCDEQLRKSLRYNSLEFGEQRIYPVSPDTVFARRIGDCKDLATSMVATLRAMGIKSHVALVHSANGLDIPQESGALGLFNHAIVYIPETDTWVDLTAEDYPVGILPARVQGRRALICDAENGRIAPTRMLSAAENQFNEVRSYDLNFSGGGHVTVGMACKGLFGLELKTSYEQSAPEQLLETWKQFFSENYGPQEVRSLQHCAYGPTNYAVRIASSAVQLLNRDKFEFVAEIDGRHILGDLPVALQPRLHNEDGTPQDISSRTLPLVISHGSRSTVTYQLLFPGALKASFKDKDWKEKFGTIELSVAFRESDISDQVGVDRDPHLKWKELVPETQAAPYKWTTQCDRELRVQFQISVEPGEVSVEDVNRCIEFVNRLHEPTGKFATSVRWNWTVLEELEEQPSSKTLRELARQARVYRSFFDPRAALAVELRRFRFDRVAQAEMADVQHVPPQFSLSLPWLTMLRSSDINGVQFSPLVDHHAIRELNRGSDLIQGSPVRFVVLFCALSDRVGLRTLDKESLEYAATLLEAHRKESDGTTRDETAMIQNDQTFVLLALRKDEELKQLFDEDKLGRFNPIESLMTGKELKVPKTMNASVRSEVKRIYWEMLISAGRSDLAHRLHRELWPEPKLLLACEDDQMPKLEPLDRTDPQSVARHAVLAMLAYEPATIESLAISQEAAKSFLREPYYCPIVLEEWFSRKRSSRSRALLEAVTKLTPVKVTDHGKAGKTVSFRNPYQKNAFALWLFQEPDGSWLVAPANPELVARRLIQYCESGDTEQATQWLEAFMPALVRELPWFDKVNGSVAARAWLLKEDPRRTELTAHLLLAEGGDLEPLEKWLSKNKDPLPNNFDQLIERLRATVEAQKGKYARQFAMELKKAEETNDLASLHYALRAAHHMQHLSGESFDLARIRAAAEKIFSPKSTDLISKHTQVELALVAGEKEKAFEQLESMLQEKKVASNTLNTYLWSSMVIKVDRSVLKERLNKVLSIEPEGAREDHFYLHTLACAQAICGDPYAAAENLAKLAAHEPKGSDELLRGLILEQLDMPQAAKSAFELCIELDPNSDSAVIAKNRLGK